MHHTDEPDVSPETCRAVAIAVGGACEWCRERYPLSVFEVHAIYPPGACPDRVHDDPQKGILVVCPICHRHIHKTVISREEQKEVVRYRTGPVRAGLRMVLGYTSRPYSPPETDLERCYEDCFQLDSLDLYRAGG